MGGVLGLQGEGPPSLFCDSSVLSPLAAWSVLPGLWDIRDQSVLLCWPGWAQTLAIASASDTACCPPRSQPRDHSPGCWEHWIRGHLRWGPAHCGGPESLGPKPRVASPCPLTGRVGGCGGEMQDAHKRPSWEGCPWGARGVEELPLPHVTHRAWGLGDRLHPGRTSQQEGGVSLSGGRAQSCRDGEGRRDRGPGTATRGTEQASWRHVERSLQRRPWGRNRTPGPGRGGRRCWVGVITDLRRGEEVCLSSSVGWNSCL